MELEKIVGIQVQVYQKYIPEDFVRYFFNDDSAIEVLGEFVVDALDEEDVGWMLLER